MTDNNDAKVRQSAQMQQRPLMALSRPQCWSWGCLLTDAKRSCRIGSL